ncbi:MAG: SidA/IucD/PvdA family monooxygenase [Thermoanaerobaculia bacterium]
MGDQNKRIAIVGAGPKAAAIAAKVSVLKTRGVGEVDVVVFEKSRKGANWLGGYGYTDGENELCTPPEKDVGFPYKSVYGVDVDLGLLSHSWYSFQIEEEVLQYAGYFDREDRPRHAILARYFNWVISRTTEDSQVLEPAEVTRIESAGNGKARVCFRVDEIEQDPMVVDAVVLTGPGEARTIDGAEHSERTYDAKSYWLEASLDDIQGADLSPNRIAVIGGGGAAATIGAHLARMMAKLDRPVTVEFIMREATFRTAGNNYWIDELFREPSAWRPLSTEAKRRFVRDTRSGAVAERTMQLLESAHKEFGVRIRGGTQALRLFDSGSGTSVVLERNGKQVTRKYGRVIVARGFDPWTAVEKLVFGRSIKETERTSVANAIAEDLAWPGRGAGKIRRALRLDYPLHVPMLADLAQGPGVPTLTNLGLVSDRILLKYLAPR